MRERDHSSACKEDLLRERTLKEDWLVVDGGWRHTGAEELPCELVRQKCFLGSGFWQSSSDLEGRKWELRERERERGIGWGRLGEHPDLSHSTKC
jgi:hypothetical protein